MKLQNLYVRNFKHNKFLSEYTPKERVQLNDKAVRLLLCKQLRIYAGAFSNYKIDKK